MANVTPAQWEQIKDLFLNAVELDAPSRETLLASVSDDPFIRQEVERLLSHHDRSSGFLGQPMIAGDVLRDVQACPTAFVNDEIVNGRFRIVRCIGRGGMGEVYEAVDQAVGSVHVALKTIRCGMESYEHLQMQFRREVEISRRVTHPNVCRIYDLFESRRPEPLLGEDVTLFLTMELLDGESLAERIAREGALPEAEALRFARDIAGALLAAHQQGVVHRDLKSSNVMLLSPANGSLPKAVLTDFGLALPHAKGPWEDTVGGTPDYMAPEQLAGAPADGRSDIFSLGIVIYEMLSGRRPFAAGSTISEAHRTSAAGARLMPPLDPALDPGWGKLVARCLEPRPADRFSDGCEVQKALQNIGKSKLPRRALIAAAAATASGGWLLWRTSGRSRDRRRSVAVLPFLNVGSDPEIEFFSQGLADEIARTFTRQPSLTVIASGSVHQVNSTGDLRSVGRKLSVSSILFGSVSRNNSRVRVNAQLSDTASGRFIWAGTYEEDLDRLRRLPVSVSLAVMGALQPESDVKLASMDGEQSGGHEAYRLFLLGRIHASYRTEDDLKQSQAYLTQSIALDPLFAPAHAALADTLNILAGHRDCPRDEYFQNAERAAQEALRLEPRLGEGHLALASVSQRYRWDWATAEIHFRRAIELSPGLAVAHHWYAGFLSNRGRTEEALAEVAAAGHLDPLSPSIHTAHAVYLYRSRRYDEAIAKFQETLTLFPNYSVALPQMGEVYAQKGMWEEAIGAYRKAIAAGQTNDSVRGGLGDTLARGGRTEQAREIVSQLEQDFARNKASAAPIAYVYRGLGNKDLAFYWFDVAVRQQEPAVTVVNVDPANDPLRGDPRFSSLITRLRL